MDCAGRGLDHHRVLVAERVGNGVELTGMGHQARGRPAPSSVGTEAGLQARGEIAEGQVPAQAVVPAGTGRTMGLDVPGGTTQHRLDYRPGAGRKAGAGVVHTTVLQDPDHLVTGDEGEADDVLEVARAATVQRGEVGTADPGQGRPEPVPGLAGQLGRVHVEELQRPDAGPPARAEDGGDPRGGEAGKVPLEDERLHRAPPGAAPGTRRRAPVRAAWLTRLPYRSDLGVSSGPSGSNGRAPPRLLAQCSTCQPRRRAMAASLASGLTATGKPTTSSMGRSLAESA